MSQTLPTEKSTLFSGSGNCSWCHEPGSPNTNALLDIHGKDVSPVILWRSSMMANAFRDPVWRAKVSAEIAAHPQYQQIIEDKCTTCHAPMARTEAIYNGADYYALNQAVNDPLAKDGVSCTLCHQIKNLNMGAQESFSGHYTIENVHLIYGPFLNPPANPMQNNSGYKPVYGEHTNTSELCATSTQTHFDSTIARTLRLLQQKTADLTATYIRDNSDALVIKVAVKNKTGQKFPAAYPSHN